jgi:hypothetical protein
MDYRTGVEWGEKGVEVHIDEGLGLLTESFLQVNDLLGNLCRFVFFPDVRTFERARYQVTHIERAV